MKIKWIDHVSHLVTSSYGILATPRKLRNMAPRHVKKQLAVSLVLSRLDYGNIVRISTSSHIPSEETSTCTKCSNKLRD